MPHPLPPNHAATQLTREAEPDSIGRFGMGKMERVLCATRDCERDVESPPPPSLSATQFPLSNYGTDATAGRAAV